MYNQYIVYYITFRKVKKHGFVRGTRCFVLDKARVFCYVKAIFVDLKFFLIFFEKL